MIASLAKTYGNPQRPAFRIGYPAPFRETTTVLARWEDRENACELLESDEGSFALVMYSKAFDVATQPDVTEALRPEVAELTQHETEAQKQRRGEADVLLQKSRLANLASFRP